MEKQEYSMDYYTGYKEGYEEGYKAGLKEAIDTIEKNLKRQKTDGNE